MTKVIVNSSGNYRVSVGNGSSVNIGPAYDKANSSNIIATRAYDKANSSNILALAAFSAANNAATPPGGSANTVQYNINGTTFGGMSGTSWNDTLRSLSITGATLTTSNPILNLSQTWNASGVTFTGLKFNVTDTASASTSLLMDLQVGGTSILNIRRAYIGGSKYDRAVFGLPQYSYVSGTTGGFVGFGTDENSVNFSIGLGNSSTIALQAGSSLAWNNSTSNIPSGTNDVYLYRDAAATLALRNSTTAQTFRVYNTYTDASNHEYFRIIWSSNVCYLQTAAAGTGSVRQLYIGPTGNAPLTFRTQNLDRWAIDGSGHLLAQTDNTYDIGASGANRPRNVYVVGGVNTGSVRFTAGGIVMDASGYGVIRNNSDGFYRFTNWVENGFTALSLGPSGTTYNRISHVGTGILGIKLADDSAYSFMRSKLYLETASVPSTASDTGTTGEVRWDSSHVYVCTATNTWKRAALNTW